jgi:hypothetical protein
MSNTSLFNVTPVAQQIAFDRLKTDNLQAINLEDAVIELNNLNKNANYLQFPTTARIITVNHYFQQFPVIQVLAPRVAGSGFTFDAWTADAFATFNYVVDDIKKYEIEHIDDNSFVFTQDSESSIILVMRA